MIVAGLLVGFGKRIGNGCTSGHGVSGQGRLSLRSLDAVIKLRNQDRALRRAAPKWRHALDIADWISTQFPSGSRFQMYAFNTEVGPLVEGTAGRWLDAGDPRVLKQAIDTLRNITPEGGTSLIRAYEAIRGLSPRPDQVILLTDGLPTQGRETPRRKYVDVSQRTRLFDEARRALPEGVPVDVILLPMQGDLPAAHRFWMMARDTGGSYLLPGGDWP